MEDKMLTDIAEGLAALFFTGAIVAFWCAAIMSVAS